MNMLSIFILNWLGEADSQLMIFLNGWHTPYWSTFLRLCTNTQTWLLFFVALAWVVYRNFSWKKALLVMVGIALVIFLADKVSVQVLRPFFQRMRPSNLSNPISQHIFVLAGERGGAYGFPSAHAANTFGLAFFVRWLFRNRSLTFITILWAILVCYTRIYLGKHYPGDLLFGAVVGYVCATVVYFSLRQVSRIGQPKLPPRPVDKSAVLPYYALAFTLIAVAVVSPFIHYE